MGEDVTDMATTTSQLQAKLLALTGGQVDIMLDANTFKNSTQILREMADAWEDMNDIQRASALELMGGKRQANVLSALIQNFDTVEKVIETSANSAGSALRENERWMDSIQGKIDQFNNATQSMWNNTLDSDWVKIIIDAGTEIINLVDDVGMLDLALTGLFMYISTKYMNMNWAHPIKSFKEMFGRPAAEDINLVKNNLEQLEAEYKSAKQAFSADPSKSNKKNLDDIEGRLQEYKNINNETISFQNNLASAQSELAKAQSRLDNYTGQNANTIKKYQRDVKKAQANVDALTQSQQQAAQTGMTVWQKLGVKVNGFAQKVQSAISSMLVMYAISKIMSLIGDLWDKAHESAEEAKESFEELSSALSKTESELSTLESQLKDIKSQIEDINANTPLTFTEQEELDRLKAQSTELQRQIDLTTALKEQQQYKVNESAINAADKYAQTGVKTGKTTGENVGEKAGSGALIGGGIGVATGVGTSILAATGLTAAGGAMATGTTLGAFAGPIGMLIGAVVGALAGGIIGAAVGGIESASEEKVGESLENMKEQYTKLQEEFDIARENYTNNASDKNKKKFEEAQEALRSYQSNMAGYMSEMDVYYSQIKKNWETATDEQKREYIKWADQMDTWAIQNGDENAKSNAIARIFGDEAEGGFKKLKDLAMEDEFERIRKAAQKTTPEIQKLNDAYNEAVNGNVDYSLRPIISPEEMRKYYPEFDGEVATTYDMDRYIETTDGEIAYTVKATPILENGKILTEDELNRYIDEELYKIIEQGGSKEDVLKYDSAHHKVIINITEGEVQYDANGLSELDKILGEIKEKHWETLKNNQFDLSVLSDEEVERLRSMGIYLYEVEDYFKDVAKAESEFINNDLEDVAKDINKIEDGLGSLKSAFEEVIEKGVLTAKTVMGLKEALKIQDGSEELTDAWREYLDVMMSGTASTKELTEATEKFAQVYLEDALENDALTPETKMEYVAQLRVLGVDNAEEVVDDFLQSNMVDEIEKRMSVDAEAVKAEFFEKNGRSSSTVREWDSISQSEDKVRNLAKQYGLLGKISDEAKQDIIERYNVEDKDIDNIIKKLEEKQEIENDISAIEKQQAAYDEFSDLWNEKLQDYRKLEKEVVGTYNSFTEAEKDFNQLDWYRSGAGYANSTTKEFITEKEYKDRIARNKEYQKLISSDTYKEYLRLHDELIALQNSDEGRLWLNDDLTLKPGVDADFKKTINELKDKIKNIEKEIDEDITVDIQLKLDLQDKNKLVDDIQSVYDTLKNAQKEYQEQGYLSVDTMQALLGMDSKYLTLLYDENGQLQLNEQSLLRVAEARIIDMGITQQKAILEEGVRLATEGSREALFEYINVIENATAANGDFVASQLAVIKAQLKARTMPQTKEVEKVGLFGIKYKTTETVEGDLSEAEAEQIYKGIENQVNAVQYTVDLGIKGLPKGGLSSSSGSDSEDDAFQRAMDYWENRIGANQARYEQIQNEIDLLEKKGQKANADYYNEQIELENQRLSLLQQQKAEAQSFLGTFAEGSEEWFRKKPAY